MKLKKKINIPLIIIVIVIYGLVTLKVIDYFISNDNDSNVNADNNDDITLVSTKKQSKLNSDNKFDFKELQNDPFTFTKIKKVRDSVRVHKKIVKKPPVFAPTLQFKIDGIIINNDRKMITLVDLSNNKTVFLREGETYSSIKIKSISKDKVEVVENGVTRGIEVNR
jgi:type II secretory pathway component PulC